MVLYYSSAYWGCKVSGLGVAFTDCITDLADDFKPLSVDHSKPGNLRVGEGDEVNMSLPVVQVCVCTCMHTHTGVCATLLRT